MYGGAGLLAIGLAAFVGPAAWLIAAVPGAFAGLVTGTALMRLRPKRRDRSNRTRPEEPDEVEHSLSIADQQPFELLPSSTPGLPAR